MQLRLLATLIISTLLTGCLSKSEDFSEALGDTSGGNGTASISITSYSPAVASIALKTTTTQQFIVSAVGEGTLLYAWKLDGVSVGSNLSSYTIDASLLSVGNKVLTLQVSDELGSVTQSWNVKINGTPVITTSVPTSVTASLRRTVLQNYSVTVTDPNADVLTYVWKLDGVEDVLTSTTASQNWTPGTIDVGTHTVSVDIYDGPASDAGTYKVTRTWTTYVNNFTNSCNTMENNAQTNKSCVMVGIPGIGDGVNPLTLPTSIYVRPTALEFDAAGNLFVADDMNHVVWYWNKNTSPSVVMLGVTVPVNTMKVVAGIGMAGSGGSASTKALRNFLNSPYGLAYDGTYLYISDTSNNRVRRVDATGAIVSVYTAGCDSPRQLTIVGNDLYVACYSSNIVRSYDMTTFVGTTFAGTGAAADPQSLVESTFTENTGSFNGRLRGPHAITSDASGNIYVGEYGGCRVHMYNRTAGVITLYGTYTISPNRQRIIAGIPGGPTCASTLGEPVDITAAANGNVGNVRGLSFNSAGQLLIGHDSDSIAAINFNVGSVSLLGVTLAGYKVGTVWGTGTAGYIGENQLASATRFNNPFHALEDPISGDYMVADYSNVRLRRLQVSDNKSELIAGNGGQRAATNAGQGLVEAGQEKMSAVRGFAYDSVTGELYMADSGNNRIRVLNRYGQVSQGVGTGTSGTGTEEDEYPTSATMSSPRGLVLTHKTASFGGNLVWADAGNHRIRIWNRSAANATLFGVLVSAGKVATIGGDGTAGTATSGVALQAAFNTPSGVTFDGTDLYVADTNNHCIKKISSAGVLSAFSGTCGTAGNVNGPVGAGRMNSLEGIDYYENGTHRGLVIADRGNGRIRFHRIAGSSLLFGGSTSIGDANAIACGGTFHTEGINANLSPCSGTYDVAVVGTKVCFTNYSYHNVRCFLSTGEVTTVLGPIQGIDDTTPLYFPGISLANDDYDAAAVVPNYTAQGGVAAFTLPGVLAESTYSESFGQVAYPLPLRAIDASTLVVGEYSLGLIRKVKLP